jgi:hypothetical protein
VIGGRDRRAGGTWLAIRERRAIVAMLNRREAAPVPTSPGSPRSRGLLALEVAAASGDGSGRSAPLADAALGVLRDAVSGVRLAAFTLAFVSPDACWVASHDGGSAMRVTPIPAGWHVLTHADLDDAGEPRTARLLRELEGFRPRTLDEAERGLFQRLALHARPPSGAAPALPAVCIHDGRMVTVSSSLVCLTRAEARYRHLEGRPCERHASDHSDLLSGALAGAERP